MVDAVDFHSTGRRRPCGFDSRSQHHDTYDAPRPSVNIFATFLMVTEIGVKAWSSQGRLHDPVFRLWNAFSPGPTADPAEEDADDDEHPGRWSRVAGTSPQTARGSCSMAERCGDAELASGACSIGPRSPPCLTFVDQALQRAQ